MNKIMMIANIDKVGHRISNSGRLPVTLSSCIITGSGLEVVNKFSCYLVGNLAEQAFSEFKVNSKVAIEGRLDGRVYVDAETGKESYSSNVFIQKYEILSGV